MGGHDKQSRGGGGGGHRGDIKQVGKKEPGR